MTETNEKITPLKNSEEHNKLISNYEQEIEKHKQETLDWKNACIKKEESILELKKTNERLETEKDDWKREAHAARKVYQEQKQVKEQNDFLTEFRNLQAKKGLRWEENTQSWITTK